MPAFQAVVRSTVISAMKGNIHAQKLVAQLNEQAQAERIRDMAEQSRWVDKYKSSWETNAWLAASKGKPPPLPLPDHLDFSVEKGMIEIAGPINRWQEAAWNQLKTDLVTLEGLVTDATRVADGEPDNKDRQKRLKALRRILKKQERLVPAGWDWREQLGGSSSADRDLSSKTGTT